MTFGVLHELHSEWSYLDKDGHIYDFSTALINADKTMKKYKTSYPVFDESKHKLSKPFIYRIIPQKIKGDF